MSDSNQIMPDAGTGMLRLRLQKHGVPGEVYRCPSHSGSNCCLCGGSGYRAICDQKACHEHGCQASGCSRSAQDFILQEGRKATAVDLESRAEQFISYSGFTSVSALQRHFKIDYWKANDLMKTMEALKVVTPIDDQGRRTIIGKVAP